MDMTKFEDSDDAGFKAIVGELRRWVKDFARPEIQRELSEEMTVATSSLQLLHVNSQPATILR